jgi:hypothetical protein
MTIEITTNEFNPEVREMYHNNELVSFSIDYMFNAVMAWCEGVEYKVVDFNKYFRLDNRYNTYELETFSDKIVIDIR